MKVENADLSWLLNVSNDLRRLHGDNPLEDLPLAVPEDSNACLIANAFNYECEVSPSLREEGWSRERPDQYSIRFDSREDAELYLKTIGLEDTDEYIVSQTFNIDEEYEHSIFYCPLTEQMNKIALNFDNGEYPEYDEYSEYNDPEGYVGEYY